MVRFEYKRPGDLISKTRDEIYFPFYDEPWTSYDPQNTSNCSQLVWSKLWQPDLQRDELHRKNSYYYARTLSRESEHEEILQQSPTLAILLFGSIIFCLFVPQILDILISLRCPGSLPPSSPPSPPPALKASKRLKLYHYAIKQKKRRSRRTSKGQGDYFYDPENILNYVSATRIRAYEFCNEEETPTNDTFASIRKPSEIKKLSKSF